MVTREHNKLLTTLSTEEEVKEAVLRLNGDSTGGPDGFSGHFFQYCLDIIKKDITNMVRAFFCGYELPRFLTHTNLVLIPKKEEVKDFFDIRPISLSTFANKIISKVLHERLINVLPDLISKNQTGFVKGRNISENVLLAQEIIRDINKRNKRHNVVVKLEMTKAYNRVSEIFLTRVLRKFGFLKVMIDTVWRLISKNWYSVLVNGQSYGFFQSTRGLNQGDPLSPALFILSVEALSRGLNILHRDTDYSGYCLPKWSLEINHLAYADDTILFTSADPQYIRKLIKVIREYEINSGQLVNNSKSRFYVHDKMPNSIINRIKRRTGIKKGKFPFIYLGCPIYLWEKENNLL